MTAARPAEKPRKRRGLISMLAVVVFNVILMSLLAWLLLLMEFGIYRMGHSGEEVYHTMDAIIKPNQDLLQKSSLFQAENNWLHQQIQAITAHTALNHEITFLLQKGNEAVNQWPSMKHPMAIGLTSFYQIKRQVVPLIWGISQIVLTRLYGLCLAIPLFLLCLSVGFVDGLVQRDIRKFQGARESTLLFHELKRGSAFWFFGPLFIYLVLPWPVSPQWFLVPLAIGMGVLVQLGAKSFKKYI